MTINEIEFAKAHNISPKTIFTIKDELGDYWLEIIKENPYRLMMIKGFDFKRSDTIGLKIGFDRKSPIRVNTYFKYYMSERTSDSIFDLVSIFSEVATKLELSIKEVATIVKENYDEDSTVILLDKNYKIIKKIDENNQPKWVSMRDWYLTEKGVFNWAVSLKKLPKIQVNKEFMSRFLEPYSTLNEGQKYVIEHILDKNLNILVGGGGTGKTYIMNIILNLLDNLGYTYTLLTPTGIASFNLTQKVKSGNPKRRAYTIHSMYHSKKRINTDFLVVDEVGMCSNVHFSYILSMISRNKEVRPIFVGDKYQLPSISNGDYLASLSNLISQSVLEGSLFELKEVMRASSTTDISYLCSKFCGDGKFSFSELAKEKLRGVYFESRETDIFKQIKKVMEKRGFESFEDTAVIIPQNKDEFGTIEFNNFIQNENKNPCIPNTKYKKGDIIMHIKNNKNLGVFNGELLEVVGYENYIVTARKLYNDDIVSYDYDTLEEETTLGYSFTVHKSQGATIKNVIVILINEHVNMLSRNLIYVALSRASNNLVVICDNVVEEASKISLTDKRKTFLNLLLKKNVK